MSDYKVTDSELTSIANAIRTKGGTSSSLVFPNGFTSAIGAIPTGGGSTLIAKNINANGTYDAEDDNADGYSSVVVSVPSSGGVSTDFLPAYSAIPNMTSNNLPSGVASASSRFGGEFEPWYAFDGKLDTNSSTMTGGWLCNSYDPAPWIAYKFEHSLHFGTIFIYTANNSGTVEKDVFIEGRLNEGEWENCLDSGQTVKLLFQNGTYGGHNTKHTFTLNNHEYDEIRIRCESTFYTTGFACVFDLIKVYANSSGVPTGTGYFTNDPSILLPSFGVDGNVCYNYVDNEFYVKQNGVWTTI